ncbi:sensor histidine kinase [Planctomonas psychrotolerans]|uniref:sensor histidine kinase n=1 Tax=Planctomonas psychrotolerans TaxID=2528712 RepID=UPI001D0D58C8|nr:sensor histidine kinase [Planctomonas psychrotolerans]
MSTGTAAPAESPLSRAGPDAAAPPRDSSTAAAADPFGSFWVRARPNAHQVRNDAILAGVLLVCTALSTAIYDSIGMYEERAPLWVSAIWVAVITLPLAARRVHPEIVALVLSAAFVAGPYAYVPELLFCNIALFIALYTVGAWGRSRVQANVVRGVIIFGMFVWLFTSLLQSSGLNALAPDAFADAPEDAILPAIVAFGLSQIITNLLYFGGAFYFGDRAWQSARDRAGLEARTAELATERERVAGQAVALERVRIARELHDVVAHHVSVMGVHAGAARLVLDRDPEKARQSLGVIEANARDTVDELHRMLAALRQDDEVPDSQDAASRSASTRGVEQIAELVDEARATGLSVTFERIGDERVLPPTVGLILYRIVQESLTNVRKHAGMGSPADVRIRYLTDAVEVEVSDAGVGARGSSSDGTGLGHVGMRERVAAVGGDISIGPKPRGGYRVRAVLPTSREARP